jgi:hypothetical protein
VPDVTPVTVPPEVTVATDVLLLVHAPPVVASVSVVVPPVHNPSVPVIADVAGLTVKTTVERQPVDKE